MEAIGQLYCPTHSVEEILETYLIGDNLWGGTSPSDMSIDTANSKEVMAGSHIKEQQTFKFQGSIQPALLNRISYKPHLDDLLQTLCTRFPGQFQGLEHTI